MCREELFARELQVMWGKKVPSFLLRDQYISIPRRIFFPELFNFLRKETSYLSLGLRRPSCLRCGAGQGISMESGGPSSHSTPVFSHPYP